MIISTNLVCVTFGPAIPTSCSNVIASYSCVYTWEKRNTCAHGLLLKYVVFTPNFLRITAQYHPKPFISDVIKNQVKKETLRFCVRPKLQLLHVSFNDPEYHPLQACFNVETPSLVIFELLAPACLGVTGR